MSSHTRMLRTAHRTRLATSASRTGSMPRHRRWIGWAGIALIAAAVVAAVAVGGRTTPTTVNGAAPSFRLASTAGGTVSLADYRGRTVLLYFNEGVGCDVCFYQMAKLEADGALAGAGVTVLPIVMNPASEAAAELRRFGIQTPYLIDADGSVSRAYKTLGTGHHAGLPGHSFVLVGTDGTMRWRGDYPGMWVEPSALADTIHAERG